jgi:hypothetical protein
MDAPVLRHQESSRGCESQGHTALCVCVCVFKLACFLICTCIIYRNDSRGPRATGAVIGHAHACVRVCMHDAVLYGSPMRMPCNCQSIPTVFVFVWKCRVSDSDTENHHVTTPLRCECCLLVFCSSRVPTNVHMYCLLRIHSNTVGLHRFLLPQTVTLL